MKSKSLLLIGSILLLLVGCGSDSSTSTTDDNIDKKDFFVTVESSSVLDASIVDVFDSSSSEMALELNEMFSLPDRDIIVVYKDCGVENAFYDPNTSEIVICYELLAELLGGGNYTIDQALGIFGFIFWHEAGHAFVDHFDIAVLGAEEDAVDAMSAVIMIATAETATEEEESALGIIFAGDYLNSNGAIDWADSHSVGPQRLANLVCWAWGAVPSVANQVAIQDIIDSLVAAGRDCQTEFQEKVTSVDALIGKFTK